MSAALETNLGLVQSPAPEDVLSEGDMESLRKGGRMYRAIEEAMRSPKEPADENTLAAMAPDTVAHFRWDIASV